MLFFRSGRCVAGSRAPGVLFLVTGQRRLQTLGAWLPALGYLQLCMLGLPNLLPFLVNTSPPTLAGGRWLEVCH